MSEDKGMIAFRWWKDELRAESGEARALNARLRRAGTAAEILSEEAVFRLSRALSLTDPERLALIARVLAAVKEHDKRPLARRFGQGEPPALSPLRFQRLIRTRDPGELARALRRALPLVAASCDVIQLSRDLYWWNERVRIAWCFQYFGAQAPEMAQEREKVEA